MEFLERFQIKSNIDECLDQLKSDSKIAIAVSRLHSQNYRPVPAYEMSCFDQSLSIQSYFISMYIRKCHPYLQDMQTITLRAFDGGLFVKWAKDAQFNIAESNEHEVTPLGLLSLGGALLCIVVGLPLAVSTFLAEMILYKQIRLPNPPCWAGMEKFVNTDRLFLNGYGNEKWVRVLRSRTNGGLN